MPDSSKASAPAGRSRLNGDQCHSAKISRCPGTGRRPTLSENGSGRDLRATYFKGGLSTGGGGRIGGIADDEGTAETGGTTGTDDGTTGTADGITGTVVGPTGSASGDDGGSPGVGSIGLMGSAGVIRDVAAVGAEPSGAAPGGDEVSVEPGRMRAEPALGASAVAWCKASSM